MYLVYDVVNKENKNYEVIINFPQEKFGESNIIDYSLSLFKTIKENIVPRGLQDKEIYELLDILNQVEENQLTQLDIVEMLERASTKKLENLAIEFKKNIKIGKSIVETLREANLPKYIVMSLEAAQKGGKLGNTYVNLMEILKLKIETKNKVSKILRYPKIVSTFLLVYFFLSIFYIIPASLELISMMDPEKFPEISKKLYAMSEYALKNNISFIILTLVTSFLIYKILYFSLGKLVMLVPAIKKIEIYKDISLFFSVLSSLQESGIMLYSGIKLSSEVINNDKLRKNLFEIGKKMQREGGTFHEEIKKLDIDKQISSFVFYGEKSGKQNFYYKQIKTDYNKKMNNQIDIALEFINPVTLIFIVATVLTIYIGINAPLMTFGSQF